MKTTIEKVLNQRKEYKRIVKAREESSENLQDDIKKLINNVYGEEGSDIDMENPEHVEFFLGKIGDQMKLALDKEREDIMSDTLAKIKTGK